MKFAPGDRVTADGIQLLEAGIVLACLQIAASFRYPSVSLNASTLSHWAALGQKTILCLTPNRQLVPSQDLMQPSENGEDPKGNDFTFTKRLRAWDNMFEDHLC